MVIIAVEAFRIGLEPSLWQHGQFSQNYQKSPSQPSQSRQHGQSHRSQSRIAEIEAEELFLPSSQHFPNIFPTFSQHFPNIFPISHHWHSHRFGDIGSDPGYNKSCLAVWKMMSRIAGRVGDHLEFLWFVTAWVWFPLSSRCELSFAHGGRDSDPLHVHVYGTDSRRFMRSRTYIG